MFVILLVTCITSLWLTFWNNVSTVVVQVGPREIVAVKCVLKKSLNKISTENLLTEIELLKTLKHEHIVQLKDFEWDKHYIYLIMEFCNGGDLSTFLKLKKALHENLVRKFLQQIGNLCDLTYDSSLIFLFAASALKYMHEKNVAHLDLKPQNILMTSRTSPRLKIAGRNMIDWHATFL